MGNKNTSLFIKPYIFKAGLLYLSWEKCGFVMEREWGQDE